MSSAPGVSVQEMFSLSLSVRANATAVPLLVGRFLDKKGSALGTTKGITRIANWLDYSAQFSEDAVAMKVVVVSTPPAAADVAREDSGTERKSRSKQAGIEPAAGDYTHTFTIDAAKSFCPAVFSLRHYFDNGGGPCYLLPYADEKDAGIDKIAGEIAKYPEISLLTLAEPVIETAVEQKIAAQFDMALKGDKGRFLIASGRCTRGADGKLTAPVPPATTADQTGLYAPFLTTPCKYVRADSLIAVSGYLDGKETTPGTPDVQRLSELMVRNPALYARIVIEVDKEIAAHPFPTLPPGPAVAGAYCRTDAERGVWKAPANVVLRGVSNPDPVITEDEHAILNDKGVNVIRSFSDRGAVIYGSRTLAQTTDWRYIPVRRLFGAVERDIQQALRSVVFEPNSAPTWEKARGAIDRYLFALWRQGALSGGKPGEAYFVHVGKDITMSDDDIKLGRMIVKVGLAAVRPAEFIILQFTHEIGAA